MNQLQIHSLATQSLYLYEPLYMQEKFISTVTKIIERKVEDTQKKKAGWFTPDMMKSELKWSG